MLVGEFRAILAQVAGRIGLALEAHLTFEVGIPGEPIRIVDIGACSCRIIASSCG